MSPPNARTTDIYNALRQAIIDSAYDDGAFPTSSMLAAEFGVSRPTVSAVVARLTDEGFLIRRPGRPHEVASSSMRASLQWAMTGRYARARAAQGLVFQTDLDAPMEKRTISVDWVTAPPQIAVLLGTEGAAVLARRSRIYVDDVPVEETTMYFPTGIVAEAPDLETAESIKVVDLIEGTGRVITSTENRILARPATQDEIDILRLDGAGPPIVYEWTHCTRDADGVAVEAVINVKPAYRSVLVFHTWEGPEETPSS